MASPAQAQKQGDHRRFNWQIFLHLSLGIVIALVGMLVYRFATDTPPLPPNRDAHVESPKSSKNAVDVAAIREQAWQRIQPRLKSADAKTQALTNQLVERIEIFFNGRKEGAGRFAEAALSWSSKWELIKSREGHRKFIESRFSEYIFTQDELAALLQEAADEYAQGLRAAENEFLVQVRADLKDLPTEALPAFANEQMLASRFHQIVATVASEITRDLQVDVGQAIGSLVIGEVVAVVVTKTLTAAATRLGISGAIVGTSANTAWATWGAGLAIGIAVDYLLDWIIGWFHDSVGNIADKVTASLEDVKRSITMGDPEAWKVHDRLAEIAAENSDSELRTQATEVLANIERGGALGLKHTLRKVADVQSGTRERALRQLVFEEAQ